jgi:hypothetical protein
MSIKTNRAIQEILAHYNIPHYPVWQWGVLMKEFVPKDNSERGYWVSIIVNFMTRQRTEKDVLYVNIEFVKLHETVNSWKHTHDDSTK